MVVTYAYIIGEASLETETVSLLGKFCEFKFASCHFA